MFYAACAAPDSVFLVFIHILFMGCYDRQVIIARVEGPLACIIVCFKHVCQTVGEEKHGVNESLTFIGLRINLKCYTVVITRGFLMVSIHSAPITGSHENQLSEKFRSLKLNVQCSNCP